MLINALANSKCEAGYDPIYDSVRRPASGVHLTLADTQEYLQRPLNSFSSIYDLKTMAYSMSWHVCNSLVIATF
jgi:hypothetical protein